LCVSIHALQPLAISTAPLTESTLGGTPSLSDIPTVLLVQPTVPHSMPDVFLFRWHSPGNVDDTSDSVENEGEEMTMFWVKRVD
jgi:hypothetical protein